MAAAFSVAGLSKTYETIDKKISALSNVTFEIKSHEFVSIIGRNASGKSTLLKIVAGILPQTSGSISISQKIAYMPQDHALLPWMTIEENLLLPFRLRGIVRCESREKAHRLLDEFGFLHYASLYPDVLSGGTRQKIALLRTVLQEHPLLLLDEPFAPLDALSRLAAQDWLGKLLEKRQSTVILITHDIREAIFFSDRIIVFRNGSVGETIEVPLPRPRIHDQLSSSVALELERKLFSLLV